MAGKAEPAAEREAKAATRQKKKKKKRILVDFLGVG